MRNAERQAAQHKLAVNRRALHDYFVLQKIETGIALRGTEVKSAKGGEISLAGSYAKAQADGIFLFNANIAVYAFGNRFNHVPDRPRRLLLHADEIRKLRAQVEQKGLALIPLSAYLKRGMVKIELGLCRGKREADKRETLRRKTAEREADRAMSAYRR
jgi:SsrA-binding protein